MYTRYMYFILCENVHNFLSGDFRNWQTDSAVSPPHFKMSQVHAFLRLRILELV